MKKTPGIDLGKNSVGWALVKDSQKNSAQNAIPLFANRTKTISVNKAITCSLTLALALLTVTSDDNWQFWLGLNITSLLTCLTLNKSGQ